jgi:hypothetical protein
MLFFLSVWLFILWLGSVALESTGMERSRARFHALSALSGTGFTTSHAEAIVENPVRRRIVATLIFIGNAGILSFLIALIVFIREGVTMPELYMLVVAIVLLLFLVLAYMLGLVDRITSGLLYLIKKKQKHMLQVSRVFYEGAGLALVQMTAGSAMDSKTVTVKEMDMQKYGINLIAIQDKSYADPDPAADRCLNSGDLLLCYGKMDSIEELIAHCKEYYES